MSENPQYDLALQQILATHICSIEVMAEIMIEKGIMTRQEYTSRVNQMKSKHSPGSH
ncbi:MAG: hypothetical protein QF732_03750 [Nitrospinaceae bacterium]|jgi:hypothetical protein|nr:hypothetical protein [Nitrospinaceae bacterium]|tara:strand:- start:661 stop:831 length:171 start_codon:yes stop_codon:yes gene_type:complete